MMRSPDKTDTIVSAGVTQFPRGWEVTVYSSTPDTIGEGVACGMSDRDAFYVLYRIGQAFNGDAPTSLSKVKRVVAAARKEIREDRVDPAWLVWAYGLQGDAIGCQLPTAVGTGP